MSIWEFIKRYLCCIKREKHFSNSSVSPFGERYIFEDEMFHTNESC